MEHYLLTTHNFYKPPYIGGDMLHEAMRKELGYTNFLDKFEDRKWVCLDGGVYIRKDIDAPACITFRYLHQ